MRLMIGLGNPEERFFKNRHNVGFMFLDYLNKDWIEGFDSLYQTVRNTILAKPLTWMNSSGIAAKQLAEHFNISNEDVIIVHDDLDLPFGTLRIKRSKSSGGHNGVKSIMEELNENKLIHVKFGIGRPNGMSPYDYVLSDFTKEELDFLPKLFKKAKSIVNLKRYEDMAKLSTKKD